MMMLALLAAHLIVDFPLQGDTTALQKNRHIKNALSAAVPWPYWMTAHAAAHGLAVWIVTRSVACGLAEFIAHWLIDFGKCERWFSIHVDQALHMFCKVGYVLVLAELR